jgi:hypothetical protein
MPGVCKSCFDSSKVHDKKNNCKNSQILKKETRIIKIGDSNIAGLGVFAGEDIQK